jgi:multiple sugar transport system permease protein
VLDEDPSESAMAVAGESPGARRLSVRRRRAAHQPGRATVLRGVWLTIPAWLVVIFGGLLPLVELVRMSTSSGSLLNPGASHWVGLANFRAAAQGQGLVHQTFVTLVIVFAGLVIQFPIGYAVARVLTWRPRFLRFWQGLLVVPMVLTPVAIGLVWKFLLDPTLGLQRWVLSAFGLQLNLFASTSWALVMIIAVDAWLNIPFVIVLLYAGMVALPQEQLDAAKIDGASWWQEQRYVHLPLLKPVLLVTAIIRVINDIMLFDIIYILTQGGPGTSTQNLSLLSYQELFHFFQSGQAAAAALVLALISIPTFFLFNRFVRPRVA